MNSQELYQYYFAACVNYVYLTRSVYPSPGFVVLFTLDNSTTQIVAWNDPSAQPNNATLQSYTVSQVLAALQQYDIQNGLIQLLGENYPISVQSITDTTPTELVNINNLADYGNITVSSIDALSFLESSDNFGYTIYVYDSTRNITIASDHFSNTINGWNTITLLNQLPQNSDVIVNVYAFCNTSTTTAYVDNIAINYYYA